MSVIVTVLKDSDSDGIVCRSARHLCLKMYAYRALDTLVPIHPFVLLAADMPSTMHDLRNDSIVAAKYSVQKHCRPGSADLAVPDFGKSLSGDERKLSLKCEGSLKNRIGRDDITCWTCVHCPDRTNFSVVTPVTVSR